MRRAVARRGLMALMAVAAYGAATHFLFQRRTPDPKPELLVTLPRATQTLLAFGDRYLAADILGFRVLLAETSKMRREDYSVQARLHTDLAWMNPAHEDGYYIAANILPWGGEVDVAERVLQRAGEARPRDFLPYFHVGFIWYHFRKKPDEGAKWLLLAAQQAEDQADRWGLQEVAAKWVERGYSTTVAAQMVTAMAKAAPAGGFRSYLSKRARRLEMLVELRDAVAKFKQKFDRAPANLNELVTTGVLPQGLPVDPLGVGFVLRADGEPGFFEGRK